MLVGKEPKFVDWKQVRLLESSKDVKHEVGLCSVQPAWYNLTTRIDQLGLQGQIAGVVCVVLDFHQVLATTNDQKVCVQPSLVFRLEATDACPWK